MPTPLEIIDEYDLTHHDLNPDAGPEPYEPSRMAEELAEVFFDVATSWIPMNEVLDSWSSGKLKEFRENLEKRIDDWDHNER